ncbi:MAG: Sec-independent protein translocase protein TatB [Rhodanobacter sp.]
MIEFSLGKLVLLALIALIVLGPEKLPGAARTAGALLRRVRSGWDDVRSEVERELQVEEIRRAAREAVAQAEAAQQEVKDGLREVHAPLAEVVNQVATTSPSTNDIAAEAEAKVIHPGELIETSPQAELPLGEPVWGDLTSGEPASPMRSAAHDDA